MRQNTFAMRLKPGCQGEYKRRHDAIWPELKAELRKAGISNYSIYLDSKTNTLFAVQNLAEDATDAELPKLPVVQKWWHMMADLMDTNPDESPVCDPLVRMFHMD